MSNLPTPQFPQDFYLNELCKKKLSPVTALNGITANALSQELNLIGANSIKFYIEITGSGTVQVDVLGSSASGGVFVSNGVSKYFSASQSFMLPCTSDFIKVQLTVLSGTPTVTVRAQGMVGVGVDDVVPKYKDLGLCINAINMAAGAIAYSNYVDNVQWVRSLYILANSDQQFEVAFQMRDTIGSVPSWNSTLQTALGGSGGAWQPLKYTTILGYSGRFAIKNISAVSNTFANMKVQLLGV